MPIVYRFQGDGEASRLVVVERDRDLCCPNGTHVDGERCLRDEPLEGGSA